MVAYSFQRQFIAPIVSGRKRQTIRARRKRHARKGEALQLYTAMRTKNCRLIGRAICASVEGVRLDFVKNSVAWWALDAEGPDDAGIYTSRADLDHFAQQDGFKNWAEMRAFWDAEHGDEGNTIGYFEGVLISWRDFEAGAEATAARKEQKEETL